MGEIFTFFYKTYLFERESQEGQKEKRSSETDSPATPEPEMGLHPTTPHDLRGNQEPDPQPTEPLGCPNIYNLNRKS